MAIENLSLICVPFALDPPREPNPFVREDASGDRDAAGCGRHVAYGFDLRWAGAAAG